jgi:FkbM family methyltransferase
MRRQVGSLIRRYLASTRPHPGRGLLARLGHWIDPADTIYEFRPGCKVRINLGHNDDVFLISPDSNLHGELDLFASHLRPGMTVFDVGANVGLYSLLAARAVGPSGRVYGFEPTPETFKRLCDNIALNGFDWIIPQQAAVYSAAGKQTLHIDNVSVTNSLFGNPGAVSPFAQGARTSLDVETITLDEFVERNQVASVGAIKIDVEGAELHVMQGANKLLARADRPVLLVEMNAPALAGAGTSVRELFDRIVGHGYQAHQVVNRQLVRLDAPAPRHTYPSEQYSNYLFLPSS